MVVQQSSRADEKVPVAMPVSWAELAQARRSDAFTIAVLGSKHTFHPVRVRVAHV